MRKKIVFILFILKIIYSQDVPMLINYQAKLMDNSNTVITGTVSVTFRFYDAIDGGTQLWTEEHSSIQSTNGLIHVLLGSVTTFDNTVFLGSSIFLETEVSGYGILSPRQQLTSVPYAIKASNTLELMYYTNSILQPDSPNTGTQEIVFDTTFVLNKSEFLKVEASLLASYTDGMGANVYFGLVGSEVEYGYIYGNDAGNESSSENYHPQAWWNIPIDQSWVGASVRLYIKVTNTNYMLGSITNLFIWGK